MTRRGGLAIASLALAVAAFAFGAQVASRGWPALPFADRPGARVRAALREVDPLARTAALLPVLRGLRGPEDLVEVLEAYEASFSGVGPGGSSIQLLCEAWAPLYARDALERIQRWPDQERTEGVRACLRTWARREPRAAYQWAVRSGEVGGRQAVFSGWAESGDPAMWDFVAGMREGQERELASVAVMQSIVAQRGLDDLFARVEALPDDAPGSFKLAAFRTAVSLAAHYDPARALAFVDRHAGGPYDKSLLQRLAVQQVQRDGPGTMQMLLDRPAGSERDWALREAYVRWLRTDREAALAWVPEAAAGDPRFLPLCELYAAALALDDPAHPEESIARAVRWADGIADAEKRHQVWVRLGGIWLSRDPEAATPWLKERGLEAEVVARRRPNVARSPSGERAPTHPSGAIGDLSP